MQDGEEQDASTSTLSQAKSGSEGEGLKGAGEDEKVGKSKGKGKGKKERWVMGIDEAGRGPVLGEHLLAYPRRCVVCLASI